MTQQKRHPAGSQCCSLIGGRLTAMSQDLAGKVWDSHTESFCITCTVLQITAEAYTRKPSITLQPRFLPVHLWAVFAVLIRVMMIVKDAPLPSSGAAMWKTEPMRRKKSSQSSAKLRNEVELHHLTQMVVVAGGMRLELKERWRCYTFMSDILFYIVFIWNWITFNLKV